MSLDLINCENYKVFVLSSEIWVQSSVLEIIMYLPYPGICIQEFVSSVVLTQNRITGQCPVHVECPINWTPILSNQHCPLCAGMGRRCLGDVDHQIIAHVNFNLLCMRWSWGRFVHVQEVCHDVVKPFSCLISTTALM